MTIHTSTYYTDGNDILQNLSHQSISFLFVYILSFIQIYSFRFELYKNWNSTFCFHKMYQIRFKSVRNIKAEDFFFKLAPIVAQYLNDIQRFQPSKQFGALHWQHWHHWYVSVNGVNGKSLHFILIYWTYQACLSASVEMWNIFISISLCSECKIRV